MVNKGRQVAVKQRTCWQTIGLATLAVALRFTCQHQMWLAASTATRLQVAYRVAGSGHAFERHAKTAANLLKQAG